MRPSVDAQHVNQAVGVDVVEAIARRHIRRLILKDRGEVGIFAVEVNHVRAEVPLLKQVAAARNVVHPGTGLFRPGFVAVEPLPEGPQRHSRRLAHQRLVRRLVNHKAVDAVQQFLVGRRLQRRRRPRPGRTRSRASSTRPPPGSDRRYAPPTPIRDRRRCSRIAPCSLPASASTWRSWALR